LVTPLNVGLEHFCTYTIFVLDKIRHFFEHYKELEPGKFVRVVGYANDQVARQKIKEATDRYSAGNR